MNREPHRREPTAAAPPPADQPHRERIRGHYEARVHPRREGFDILDWSSRQSQEVRFQVLVDALRAAGADRWLDRPWARLSVLDVGCGMTELCTHLHRHGWRGHYVGVDITPGILGEAHRRAPDRDLALADVFAATPFRAQAFDVVFSSGIFNLELGNNEAFACRALPVLYGLARVCAVSNFLHERARLPNCRCAYFSPTVLSRAASRAGARVEMRDEYLQNDFTLALWRPPAVG